MITSLDAGDSIVVAMSFSHMLNLANLAEEVQISRRRRKKVKKGHFADENNATTDEIKRTPLRPQDELRPGMSYFHETIWNGVSRFHQAICTFLRSYGNDMINIDHCCYHHLRVLIHLNR
ncbi:hypothetical protein VIGAN_03056300 [Vigna angularis var. angularis]|uniref:Uncharacterized protein n=2 Tax=Phaseolus angularis TaxID=3914 RepID=A0A0S3RK55_PHAAN|nr:hypothetical protein VIGAN_03056300 [Vigna angularis var. angularis]